MEKNESGCEEHKPVQDAYAEKIHELLQENKHLKAQLQQAQEEIEKLKKSSDLDDEELKHKWKLLETASAQNKLLREKIKELEAEIAQQKEVIANYEAGMVDLTEKLELLKSELPESSFKWRWAKEKDRADAAEAKLGAAEAVLRLLIPVDDSDWGNKELKQIINAHAEFAKEYFASLSKAQLKDCEPK